MAPSFAPSPQLLTQLRAAKTRAAQQFLRSTPAFTAVASASAVATADPPLNLVGVGIGRKRTAGRLTAQPCVRLYVRRKLPANAISALSTLPANIEGVLTDVIETGPFRAFAPNNVIAKARSRLRPLLAGCSIGFQFPAPKNNFVMAGTLGAIVERGGQLFLLSNNHVLADEGRLAAGAFIFQPGLLDGGQLAGDRVATLTQFIPFTATGNTIDAAIAQIDNPTLAARKFVATVTLKSVVSLPATVNLSVHKVGRTTGYTTGVIEDISADVKVGYDSGEFLFTNQIIIKSPNSKPFSDAGDSGSLIVARLSGRATGLLFAGSTAFTLANHIEPVLAAFGAALVK